MKVQALPVQPKQVAIFSTQTAIIPTPTPTPVPSPSPDRVRLNPKSDSIPSQVLNFGAKPSPTPSPWPTPSAQTQQEISKSLSRLLEGRSLPNSIGTYLTDQELREAGQSAFNIIQKSYPALKRTGNEALYESSDKILNKIVSAANRPDKNDILYSIHPTPPGKHTVKVPLGPGVPDMDFNIPGGVNAVMYPGGVMVVNRDLYSYFDDVASQIVLGKTKNLNTIAQTMNSYRGIYLSPVEVMNDRSAINGNPALKAEFTRVKEGMLAFALAHEYAHHTQDHARRRLNREPNDISDKYTTNDVNYFNLKLSRDDEFEADAKAIEFVIRAGYDPKGANHVISALGRLAGTPLPNDQMDHASSEDRLRRVKAVAAKYGQRI